MTGRLAAILAVVLLGGGCDERPPCKLSPLAEATGSADVQSGELTPGAQAQRVTISADRTRFEYTFTRDGRTFTAVYALGQTPPPPALRHVAVRRPASSATCTALSPRGPTVDAVEVRRRGAVIGPVGADAARSDCRPADEKAPATINGPPDGQGALLGSDVFRWALPERVALREGDEVAVTVLASVYNEPYEVVALSFEGVELLLGTAAGSTRVTVPAWP